MYRAVLDTCALVPGRQRDFLLQLAAEEAYAPLWGSGILVELDYVLARLDAKRGRQDSAAYRKPLFAQMKRAFPGAEINATKDRDYEYGLRDPDDGHVAQAALLGKGDAIVTDDTRAGFRTSPTLLDAGIEVVYSHEFAANAVSAHPQAGVESSWTSCRRGTRWPRLPRSSGPSWRGLARDHERVGRRCLATGPHPR